MARALPGALVSNVRGRVRDDVYRVVRGRQLVQGVGIPSGTTNLQLQQRQAFRRGMDMWQELKDKRPQVAAAIAAGRTGDRAPLSEWMSAQLDLSRRLLVAPTPEPDQNENLVEGRLQTFGHYGGAPGDIEHIEWFSNFGGLIWQLIIRTRPGPRVGFALALFDSPTDQRIPAPHPWLRMVIGSVPGDTDQAMQFSWDQGRRWNFWQMTCWSQTTELGGEIGPGPTIFGVYYRVPISMEPPPASMSRYGDPPERSAGDRL